MSASAPPRFVVHPGRSLGGTFVPPGDKSITHRAYLLGALAEGETRVEAGNPGADCASTLACLAALGVAARRDAEGVTIEGRGPAFDRPRRVLDCGNSGTTLRLLAGPLAAQPFASALAGDASLNRRPVDRVIEPLRAMGAKLRARDGDRFPPLEIEGGPLRPIRYRVASNSAQVASCVLLAGLWAPGTTTVELGAARDHTERMLPAFGVPVTWEAAPPEGPVPRSVTGPARLRATRLRVPGDPSAAAFLLAAAAIRPGARVTASAVGANPTRTEFLRTLERMGVQVEERNLRAEGGEPVADVTVIGPDALLATDVPPSGVPAMIDEVPIWAVTAALARGVSRIRGAAELRVKESDRLAALATQLRCLGIDVEEATDGLAITGGAVRGGTVDAGGDHRIAMAFAILATRAQGPVTIRGAREIATSYPGFLETLRSLGAQVEIPEEDAIPR